MFTLQWKGISSQTWTSVNPLLGFSMFIYDLFIFYVYFYDLGSRWTQSRKLMYKKAWESHSFYQLRALFHLVCLRLHPCYSCCHEPFKEKDGDGEGRILGKDRESFILRDGSKIKGKSCEEGQQHR